MSAETLYIGINGEVAAIDPADGSQAWRTSLSKGFFSGTGQQDVCVLQHGGRVFAGCMGHLFCLDAASGEILWHNGLEGMGFNDVTLAIGNQSVQYISSHGGSSGST